MVYGPVALGPVVRQYIRGAHGEKAAHLMMSGKQKGRQEGARAPISHSRPGSQWPSTPS
jgi:hypothetical protein